MVVSHLLLNPTGHHRWHKTEEGKDSKGSNYSGDEDNRNAWGKQHKRRSVTSAVSDEDYRSSQEEEEDEDGIVVAIKI